MCTNIIPQQGFPGIGGPGAPVHDAGGVAARPSLDRVLAVLRHRNRQVAIQALRLPGRLKFGDEFAGAAFIARRKV